MAGLSLDWNGVFDSSRRDGVAGAICCKTVGTFSRLVGRLSISMSFSMPGDKSNEVSSFDRLLVDGVLGPRREASDRFKLARRTEADPLRDEGVLGGLMSSGDIDSFTVSRFLDVGVLGGRRSSPELNVRLAPRKDPERSPCCRVLSVDFDLGLPWLFDRERDERLEKSSAVDDLGNDGSRLDLWDML